MKIYMAGCFTNGVSDVNGTLFQKLTPKEQADCRAVPHHLESYHYIHHQKKVEMIRKNGKQVFLDSGAFSAFTSGVTIDLPKFCRYIQENDDIIYKDDGVLVASVLDGIGDPLKTWQNQLEMERHGVRPLPCFHYGEDERYLEWYIQKYEYITLGGMVPIAKPQLYYWLDRIWEKYLCDGSGRPRLKVHGFGLTTIGLMERYPWWSVDSSSWVQSASNGAILLSNLGYGLRYATVSVSSKAPARRTENQHIDTLAPILREALIKQFETEGYSLDRLQNEYVSRWVYNLKTYNQMNADFQNPDPRYVGDQMRLF